MRLTHSVKLITLGLVVLIVASGCGATDSVKDRVAEYVGETTQERLAAQADATRERLQGFSDSGVDVVLSDTVTLRELQSAGISVGSPHIDCDRPLHMVVVDGMFDRDGLFSTGVALAGGSAESLAMRLVAEIYDPATDMPLGIVGDADGSNFNGIIQDSSLPNGGGGSMVLDTSNAGDADELIPEAVCQ